MQQVHGGEFDRVPSPANSRRAAGMLPVVVLLQQSYGVLSHNNNLQNGQAA